MKAFVFMFFTLLMASSLAQLKISVNPLNPLKEESFNVIFEITTDSEDEPMVSFDPVGVEVLGRSQEVSLSTTIINGRFSSTRKIKLIYEMVSERERLARITNIKVEVGGQTLKHAPVQIKILSKRKEPRNIFLQAEVSKTEAFIGEGIDVKYYLYSRAPIIQTEFKAFPKLNGFIKRFHKVNETEEAVEYEGMVYRRSLKYSARVYPEKIGSVYIDPLRLNIQYAGSSSSPFGSFGLAFNRFKSKGVASTKIEIKVLPLPTEGIPNNFMGLVGDHEFRFVNTKSKYVVNEAIEAKLEVVGPGALEKMEAPSVYKDDALEQFDTKSEFFEVGTNSGRKVFDYTYLARANVTIAEREIKMAYFDPDDKSYKEKTLVVPGLIIGGGGEQVIDPLVRTQRDENVENKPISKKVADITYGIVAPLFTEEWKSIPMNWHKWVTGALFIVIIIQLLELLISASGFRRSKSDVDEVIKSLKKRGLTYSSLTNLLYMLNDKPDVTSVKQIIKESGLTQNEKDYFIELVMNLENKNFSDGKEKAKKVRFKASAFKSLRKEFKNAGL
ncbi:MAG: BatD family protein [Bacteriovoracaceae bacterium]|nr:BatD family protein [Bacteriovoracaceae bacterium]